MTSDKRLISDRFPRASGYHPDWVLAGVSGGANPLAAGPLQQFHRIRNEQWAMDFMHDSLTDGTAFRGMS